jgi:hypothetical protein
METRTAARPAPPPVPPRRPFRGITLYASSQRDTASTQASGASQNVM